MNIVLSPIGIINSPFINPYYSPRQGRIEGKKGSITLNEEYCDGLAGLQDFSHIIVIYCFHRQTKIELKTKPCFDPHQEHGIFATRFPARPNHIGMSILGLTSIEGNILHCADVDVLDGTPLLDIKPYVKYFDKIDNSICGWYDNINWATIEKQTSQTYDPPYDKLHSSVAAILGGA